MARPLPRTRFTSARLVGLLAALTATDTAAARQDFAERLGQWLDFTDGLALFSALNAAPPGEAAAPVGAVASCRDDLARVRRTLADSIACDGVLKPGKARIELPTPTAAAADDRVPDYAPYHRYYVAHQRDMAAAIGPLRARVRAELARRSPALRRLAALDAVMDQALAARERTLLATVPQLLGRRFEQLYEAHRAGREAGAEPDAPERWLLAGAWLATFCTEMQSVLLAELDLRLQTTEGLIEALGNEVTR